MVVSLWVLTLPDGVADWELGLACLWPRESVLLPVASLGKNPNSKLKV